MMAVSVPDFEVQTVQGTVVPLLEHVAPTSFLEEAAELSHAVTRFPTRLLIAREHGLDLRRKPVERRHHFTRTRKVFLSREPGLLVNKIITGRLMTSAACDRKRQA